MEYAFHEEPKGRDVTTRVYEQIVKYFQVYDYCGWDYLGPYALIIGPSGIGKSFLVQQLARQNHAYVVYATASLVHVELCRELGITAAGFFDLQVKETFDKFQRSLLQNVRDFHWNDWEQLGKHKGGKPFDYRKYIDEFVAGEYRSSVRDLFHGAQDQLRLFEEYADHYVAKSRITFGEDRLNEPSVLICFDDAHKLFSCPDDPLMRFRQVDRFSDGRNYIFGLVLDTVSRVTDFSPPRRKDHRLTVFRQERFFPPIYQIDSMDIFTDDPDPDPSGSQSHRIQRR
ncbi:hypothetical protein VTN77DRAFT_6741 [Rasamsonia byssochlamydoides]|uniref:uncharacterized protein n=1 Tax=Rasamsonia byssochlamydoides TaxID=89139 RepID=UPI003742319A